jgi:hypothetical protein
MRRGTEMSKSYDRAAFFEVVKDAVPAEASYISLYASVPFYGGPEEGGWWGRDTELVAYHRCTNAVEAEAIEDAVREMAEKMSAEAKDRFNRQCAREIEWVEEHDPMADESDYFPEPDGEESYFVAVETRPGSLVSQAERSYS